MDALSYRGGARLGWVSASWPFARLLVERGELTLSSLGKYSFAPQDVVALEPYGSIPLVARGIRIRHNRQDRPETLVFWFLGDRDAALADIERVFRPAGVPKPRAPGFSIRWSVLAALVALLLLPLTLGMGATETDMTGPPPGFLAVLALLFGVSGAVRVTPAMQRLVLRPGHHVGEIVPYLMLMQLVSVLQLIAFSLSMLLI